MEMNTKNLLVSFVTIAIALFLVATISAADITDKNDVTVKVDGIDAYDEEVSVIAGETITVKVYFTSDECDTDVTIEAELEGEKIKVDTITSPFDVEDGKSYRKVLNIKVPYELKDQRSDNLTLNIEIDGKEYKTELDEIILRVQRPSYNADIKSITVSNLVEAGETFPVDIVLKNIGYNDLDDLYVAASISALGIEKTSYFGDLVALECCENEDDVGEECPYDCCDEDDEDTASGRLYLKLPYDVEGGIYTLEIKVTNDDTTTNVVKQIVVKNDLEKTVIKSGNDLIIVNPTNKVKVYSIVVESPASSSDSVVVVPAGSSRTVAITPNVEGEYSFDVSVFSGEELVSTIAFSGSEEQTSITNPVVMLTVVLAIIFLVLLIVLIVLITKKPEKSEEFGESYY